MKSRNRMDRRIVIAGLVVAGVFAAGAVWYLGSPLFINRQVNEALPVAQNAMPMEDTMNEATAEQDDMAKADGMTMTQMVAETAAMTQTDHMSMDGSMTKTEAMTMSDAPAALSSGSFTEVDNIHKGAGQAIVYQLPDGKRVLRFENFNVTNGPDLFVYLAGSAMPRSSSDLHSAGALEVARLKGNIGDQNYELPADLDLSKFKSVVIYCRQFSVVFSTADLMQAG